MKCDLASLPDRVKAAVIDSIIIIVMTYGATELLAMFKTVPTKVSVIISAIIFLLYDPLLIFF